MSSQQVLLQKQICSAMEKGGLPSVPPLPRSWDKSWHVIDRIRGPRQARAGNVTDR